MANKPFPRHPKNAPGPFYVEDECCISCEAPESMAPDLMDHRDERFGYHCHFKKQPSTPGEIERAIMACCVSCVKAVRYAGDDPAILERFRELGGNQSCDVLLPPASAKPLTLEQKLGLLRESRGEMPGASSATAGESHPLWDREMDS